MLIPPSGKTAIGWVLVVVDDNVSVSLVQVQLGGSHRLRADTEKDGQSEAIVT